MSSNGRIKKETTGGEGPIVLDEDKGDGLSRGNGQTTSRLVFGKTNRGPIRPGRKACRQVRNWAGGGSAHNFANTKGGLPAGERLARPERKASR